MYPTLDQGVCYHMELLLLVAVVVVFVVPLLPSLFSAAPSSVVVKGGNVRTQYDRRGRYVPSSPILQRVQYIPQCASDGRCLYGQPY